MEGPVPDRIDAKAQSRTAARRDGRGAIAEGDSTAEAAWHAEEPPSAEITVLTGTEATLSAGMPSENNVR